MSERVARLAGHLINAADQLPASRGESENLFLGAAFSRDCLAIRGYRTEDKNQRFAKRICSRLSYTPQDKKTRDSDQRRGEYCKKPPKGSHDLSSRQGS